MCILQPNVYTKKARVHKFDYFSQLYCVVRANFACRCHNVNILPGPAQSNDAAGITVKKSLMFLSPPAHCAAEKNPSSASFPNIAMRTDTCLGNEGLLGRGLQLRFPSAFT